MSKYYKIALSPVNSGVVDDGGTNVLGKESFKGGNTEIVWKLNDTPIAEQFYNITESAIADDYRWLHWNKYDANQTINMEDLINSLNTDIDTQGADPKLKLSIDDPEQIMHDKLNEVHYVFEKDLVDLQEDPAFVYTEEYHPEVEILERLNKTVHEIEANMAKFFSRRNIDKNDLKNKQYFLVTRHFSPNAEQQYKDLTDEDYNTFQSQYWTGDLFLDFFTVGKDLSHAYSTNDIELIKRKEIKPQTLITGSACFGLEQKTFQQFQPEQEERIEQMMDTWCTQNEVDQYGIDWKEPKHKVGRAKLGELHNETFESVIAKIESCPFISDIIVWEEHEED